MTTLAQVNQALLDKQKSLIDSCSSVKELAFITKAIADANKTIGSDGTLQVLNTNNPYGVLWNSNTDEYFTLGHGVPVVQMQMRRCVCNRNPAHGGTVVYYLDANDSTKKEDGSDASADIAGANGYQVFVEIPRFYQKKYAVGSLNYYEIAIEPFEGSETHHLFRRTGWTAGVDGTDSSNEVAFDYISAFEGVLYDASASAFIDGNGNSDNTSNIDTGADSLKSVAGFKPYSGITRAEARTLISNGGGKQINYYQLDALITLFVTEYKTFNSQDIVEGYSEFTSGASYLAGVVTTGLTLSLGNNTGNITGKASDFGGTNTTTRVLAMSYRGVENIFGHLWQWIDGINISSWKPYLIKTVDLNFADDIFTGDYLLAKDSNNNSVVMPTSNGYQSTLNPGTFFPKSVGASSAQKITDYYWQSSGNRVFRSGAYLYDGRCVGLCTVSVSADSSGSSWDICGR